METTPSSEEPSPQGDRTARGAKGRVMRAWISTGATVVGAVAALITVLRK